MSGCLDINSYIESKRCDTYNHQYDEDSKLIYDDIVIKLIAVFCGMSI